MDRGGSVVSINVIKIVLTLQVRINRTRFPNITVETIQFSLP